ncbi:putative ATP-dependent helicase IRC3 [Oleoguttula sp. CCFEE 5521]
MAEEHASGNADITIASMKSITSGERMFKYDPARFKLLLVDEAHHIAATTYLKVLKHFGLQEKHSQSHVTLVGVSATLSRADGLSLGTAIDHIVYHLDLKEMIRSKYLSDAIFTAIRSHADLSKVKSSASNGDFQVASLGHAVNTAANNNLTVRCWLANAADRKATLVFCVNIAHAKDLTEAFRREGVDARYITGKTSVKVRSETLAALKRGDFKVLLNVGVLIEGFDLPEIDCVHLARPTKSSNLLVQMIGRGLRKHPGKQNCLIIDMVASHQSSLVSTPTLLGLDPQELDRIDAATLALMGQVTIAEREEMELVADHLQEEALPQTHDGDITVQTWDSLLDLINPTADEAAIAQFSPNVWVQISPTYYVLSSTWIKDFVSVRVDGHEWAAKMTPSLRFTSSKLPYGRPRHIATAATLEDAVKAADEYAIEKYQAGIRKEEPWRSRPASDKQLGYLQKLLGTTEDLNKRGLTGGQVRNMIVKLLRGSKGLYKRIQAEKAKARRAKEKEEKNEELKRKAIVKVGPVE